MRSRWSKANVVISHLLAVAGKNVTEVSNMPLKSRSDLFDASFQQLIKSVYPDDSIEDFDSRHMGSKSYTTIYDITESIRKANK